LALTYIQSIYPRRKIIGLQLGFSGFQDMRNEIKVQTKPKKREHFIPPEKRRD
jgi:hypothetical protein